LLKITIEEIRFKALQLSEDSEYIGALIENKPIEALYSTGGVNYKTSEIDISIKGARVGGQELVFGIDSCQIIICDKEVIKAESLNVEIGVTMKTL
jgi:hypothetical protein